MEMACPSLKTLQRYFQRRDFSRCLAVGSRTSTNTGPVATSLLLQTGDLKDLQITGRYWMWTAEGRSLFAPRLLDLDRGPGNRRYRTVGRGHESSTGGNTVGGHKDGLESDSLV